MRPRILTATVLFVGASTAPAQVPPAPVTVVGEFTNMRQSGEHAYV